MKKIVCLLIAMVWAIPTFGQAPRIEGAISTSGSDCTAANACVTIQFPAGTAGVAVVIRQTFSGTLQFEAGDGTTWNAIAGGPAAGGATATSATTTGVWQFGVAGLTAFRVRASAFASGQADVVLQASLGGPAINGTTATVSIGSATITASSDINVAKAGGVAVVQCSTSGCASVGIPVFVMNPVGAPVTTLINTAATGAVSATLTGTNNVTSNNANIATESSASRLTSSAAAVGGASTLATTAFMAGGEYHATPLTLTDTKQAELQLDSSGNLKVSGAFSSGVAQGSTTAGQTGTLNQGAVTTSAPSYTTAQTSPLSLQTDGSLRVAVTNGAAGGTSLADGATFTASSTSETPIGGVYESSPSTCATGKSCGFGMTTNRELKVSITSITAAATGPQATANSDSISCATDAPHCAITAATGDLADGALVTLGAKGDAKSTATDTTPITAMSVLKQISASVQAPPSQAVTNAGTFATQATLAAETTKVIGTVNVAAGQTIAVTNAGTFATQAAITAASSSIASGAFASGAIASGAIASGAIASGAIASGAYAAGSLNSAIPDPCLTSAKTSYPISISSATTTVVQAASSSNKFRACSLFLFASAAENVTLVEDATANCASPDAGVIGGTTTGSGINLAANQGFTLGNGDGTVAATASTNVNVCLITSSTAQLSGVITGVLAP